MMLAACLSNFLIQALCVTTTIFLNTNRKFCKYDAFAFGKTIYICKDTTYHRTIFITAATSGTKLRIIKGSVSIHAPT